MLSLSLFRWAILAHTHIALTCIYFDIYVYQKVYMMSCVRERNFLFLHECAYVCHLSMSFEKNFTLASNQITFFSFCFAHFYFGFSRFCFFLLSRTHILSSSLYVLCFLIRQFERNHHESKWIALHFECCWYFKWAPVRIYWSTLAFA